MSFLLRSKQRLMLLWGAFCVAGILMAAAVVHLYLTTQHEIAAQRDGALRHEAARINALAREMADAEQRSVLAALAAMHVDGVQNALRRWDAANDDVTDAFLWNPEEGILYVGGKETKLPDAVRTGAFVKEFAQWRSRNTDSRAGIFPTGGYMRTRGTPAFADKNMGFQDENLDIITHGGRKADPWGGWSADTTTGDWVVWYQTGPEEQVRGCVVSTTRLLKRLKDSLGDSTLAEIRVRPNVAARGGHSGVALTVPLEGFPGYTLLVIPGAVFSEKEIRARNSVIVAAALVGVFLVGAGFLVVYTRRESKDAARKTSFVSQVSHELRTPLTSIRMFADMLGGPEMTDDKRMRFSARISAESERLGALIERLLAFNALEAGKQKVAVTSVDVVHVVRETAEKLTPSVQKVGMRLQVDSSAGKIVALTDVVALQQALQNLLENAVKYAGRGLVRIHLNCESGFVRVRVSDEGPGVPASVRGTLFEPFVQGGATLTDKSPGVGLGLSIARGLMRHAGGDVVLLESVSGAVFEIRMPEHKS